MAVVSWCGWSRYCFSAAYLVKMLRRGLGLADSADSSVRVVRVCLCCGCSVVWRQVKHIHGVGIDWA